MNDQHNYTIAFTVDKSPDEVFAAINNPRAWWTGEFEGNTNKLGEEFTYEYKPYHYSKQRVTEFIPGKKIVWDVLESNLSFLANKTEWTGTKLQFEITNKGDKTEVRFTHIGLHPEIECYGACSKAWGSLITDSLQNFIAMGKVEKPSLASPL